MSPLFSSYYPALFPPLSECICVSSIGWRQTDIDFVAFPASFALPLPLFGKFAISFRCGQPREELAWHQLLSVFWAKKPRRDPLMPPIDCWLFQHLWAFDMAVCFLPVTRLSTPFHWKLYVWLWFFFFFASLPILQYTNIVSFCLRHAPKMSFHILTCRSASRRTNTLHILTLSGFCVCKSAKICCPNQVAFVPSGLQLQHQLQLLWLLLLVWQDATVIVWWQTAKGDAASSAPVCILLPAASVAPCGPFFGYSLPSQLRFRDTL